MFIKGRAYGERRYVENPAEYSRESAVRYVQSARTPVDGIEKLICENAGRIDAVDIVCRDGGFWRL